MTDAELIERLGVPDDIGYKRLRELDDNPASGFPKKDQFWGGRRYWPAIEAFLEDTQKRRLAASHKPRSVA